MISLTRLNQSRVVLNADLIEYIETTPDTVITLTTGQKLMVLESSDEIVAKVVEFRRLIASHNRHAAEQSETSHRVLTGTADHARR